MRIKPEQGWLEQNCAELWAQSQELSSVLPVLLCLWGGGILRLRALFVVPSFTEPKVSEKKKIAEKIKEKEKLQKKKQEELKKRVTPHFFWVTKSRGWV